MGRGLLVTEWIERSGGAERVVEAMGRAFPDANIHCLWTDAPERFEAGRVRESWLARTPLRRHKALALPFMIPTWRAVRSTDDPEWMLVSSHAFAHHAKVARGRLPKYVYAHTPARYIWDPEFDDRGRNLAARLASPALRTLDRRRAQEATAIAANSAFVQQRIRRTWDRDAVVIHPPVAVAALREQAEWGTRVTDDEERRVLDALPPVFVVGASRFIPYKRLDLVLEAAARLGIPAVIAGRGPEEARLRALAETLSIPVQIIISPSDALLYALMQRTAAFVFPPVEDFGIIPVEAQALGTPVVTGPVGGQLETLTPGVSGIVAASTDPADLASSLGAAIDLPPFDADAVTRRFGEDRFADQIRNFVGRDTIGA